MQNTPQCLVEMQGSLAVVAVNCFTASRHLSFVSLQRQLSKNIKFGQPPPNAIPMKKADSGEADLEDLFLTSPMETAAQQDVLLSDTENKVRLLQAMTRWLINPGRRLGTWTGASSDPGICLAGGVGVGMEVGEAFLMSNPGLEGTSWAGALICSRATLRRRKMRRQALTRALPGLLLNSSRLRLALLFWEALPGLTPKLYCLLTFTVRL